MQLKLLIAAIFLAGGGAVGLQNMDRGKGAAVEPIRVVRLLTSAEASLDFLARPSAEEPVRMPDWPVTLPIIEPESPPAVESMMDVPLQDASFTAARPIFSRDHRIVTGNGLALRAGPGKSYGTLASLNRGDVAKVTGPTRQGWVPIRDERTGKRGWVFHRYLGPV